MVHRCTGSSTPQPHVDAGGGARRVPAFCAQHGITAAVETLRIQDVNEAYARLRRNDVRHRFVIDLASLA